MNQIHTLIHTMYKLSNIPQLNDHTIFHESLHTCIQRSDRLLDLKHRSRRSFLVSQNHILRCIGYRFQKDRPCNSFKVMGGIHNTHWDSILKRTFCISFHKLLSILNISFRFRQSTSISGNGHLMECWLKHIRDYRWVDIPQHIKYIARIRLRQRNWLEARGKWNRCLDSILQCIVYRLECIPISMYRTIFL